MGHLSLLVIPYSCIPFVPVKRKQIRLGFELWLPIPCPMMIIVAQFLTTPQSLWFLFGFKFSSHYEHHYQFVHIRKVKTYQYFANINDYENFPIQIFLCNSKVHEWTHIQRSTIIVYVILFLSKNTRRFVATCDRSAILSALWTATHVPCWIEGTESGDKTPRIFRQEENNINNYCTPLYMCSLVYFWVAQENLYGKVFVIIDICKVLVCFYFSYVDKLIVMFIMTGKLERTKITRLRRGEKLCNDYHHRAWNWQPEFKS